jgi:hypothetical protein
MFPKSRNIDIGGKPVPSCKQYISWYEERDHMRYILFRDQSMITSLESDMHHESSTMFGYPGEKEAQTISDMVPDIDHIMFPSLFDISNRFL